MAGVTALRDAARSAVFGAGGRGFVRFLCEGDALLVSDAPRRCEDAAQANALIDALREAGFCARIEDGLAYITPGDNLLLALCGAQPDCVAVDWQNPVYETQALAARFLREESRPLTHSGQRLVLETARCLWQPGDKAIAGLTAIRAMAAAQLRAGDRSGLHEAGRLIAGWLRNHGV